jgi:hypothetical protein
MFDGQGCEPGVLHQIAVSVRALAQGRENAPVARPGLNNLALRLIADYRSES